jgi:hypothetical protein
MKMNRWLAASIATAAVGISVWLVGATTYGQSKTSKPSDNSKDDVTCDCSTDITIDIDDSQADTKSSIERDSPVCAGQDSTITWTAHHASFEVDFDANEGTPLSSGATSVKSGASYSFKATNIALDPHESHGISAFKYKLTLDPGGLHERSIDPHIIVIGSQGFFTRKRKGDKSNSARPN